jgi:YVTN family beta-propeller protein
MAREFRERFPFAPAGLIFALVISGALACARPTLQVLPSQSTIQALPNMGQHITPLAPQGSRFVPLNPDLPGKPGWLVDHAVTTVTSPDRQTLLILTSGYNRVYDTPTPRPNLSQSNEYVFIYDISTPTPIKKQVVQIPNTYNGMVFDPSGSAFYVAGGVSDNVHVFTRSADGTWRESGPALALGHNNVGNGLAGQADVGTGSINLQVGVRPCAAGVAISNDGKTLVVANYYNDSITVFSGGLGNWSAGRELDLRPGKSDVSKAGIPGGEYPFWVAVKGNGTSAVGYVSSIRDREIVVVNLNGGPRPVVTDRIRVKGQPNKMTLNAAQMLLYVVEDHSDTVDVIDTAKNAIVATIPVIAPASVLPSALADYRGANSNSATLSPDEKYLYVTNGNLNCIAVVALDGANGGGRVVGLIPTGWYPNSVSLSGDGERLYVVNGKSPTGPNPGWGYGYGPPTRKANYEANQYNPQQTKAGFQSFPRPGADQLAMLTAQVAVNNRFAYTQSADDAAVMAAVRQGVKHVIFIIKENRTYDQILGDLEIGNGDPDLAEFGEACTPNQHNLARRFVTLDNFYDTSEVSYDGWPWTTSARAPDVVERQTPVAYAGRGLSLDDGSTNRSVNVAYATLAERRAANPLTPDDPDLLPGQASVGAPDGPDNEVNTGYLWDAALRAKLTVRNYGFFLDCTRYTLPQDSPHAISLAPNPAATGTIVAFPASASLAPHTDPYFRGFDNSYPDYYRYREWEREFDSRYAPAGGEPLPALSLVRFMHDHTGNFYTAIDGVNTPELQQADNDYATGLLVQKIANSRYAKNTLVFIIEDDSQDGADHVDSHRSIAFVAGAWVKQGALVSTQYNTISFLRTIEMVLGLPPLNINDALARPMADIFTTTPNPWSFTAAPAPILYGTKLPLPPRPAGLIVPKSSQSAEYWARVTRGMDFTIEDRFDFASYNRILWAGLMGNKPYPATPTGLDLRRNREELLARHRRQR